MIKGVKSQAQVIVVVLIILVVVFGIVILNQIIRGQLREDIKKIDLKVISTSLNLDDRNIIINNSEEKLQIAINRGSDKVNLTTIKVVLYGTLENKFYTINDVPDSLEQKSYLLNTSGLGKIQDIIFYPIVDNDMIGVGQKKELLGFKEDIIKLNIPLIEPDIKDPINVNCISNIQCSNWDDCHVIYNLGSVIGNEVLLKGLQSRSCKDSNKCVTEYNEDKRCDSKVEITLKTVEKCNKQFLEISNKDSNLISRLELIDGRLDIQMIFDKSSYYPYCFNGIKDCDEDSVDCVYIDSGSCPKCK